jgi:predicted DNA-binding protein
MNRNDKVTVTFQMPRGIKEKAMKAAKKKDMPMAMWFREVIKEALNNG